MAYNYYNPNAYVPIPYTGYQPQPSITINAPPTPPTTGSAVQPPTQIAAPVTDYGSSITWVQGEVGARAYPVPAGTAKMLMDSEQPVFYIKTVDISGIPMPLRVFDFVERTNNIVQQIPQQQTALPVVEESKEKMENNGATLNPNEYVTRREYEDLLNLLTSPNEKKG